LNYRGYLDVNCLDISDIESIAEQSEPQACLQRQATNLYVNVNK